MEAKFKVGDKVRIDHHGAKYNTIYWAEAMDKYVGKVGKVTAIDTAHGSHTPYIEINGDAWWYPSECVKLVPKRIRKPSPPIKCGDRFSRKSPWGAGQVWILAQVGFKALSLIDLKGGNRWADAVVCKDVYNVSKEEFAAITKQNNPAGPRFIRKYCFKG